VRQKNSALKRIIIAIVLIIGIGVFGMTACADSDNYDIDALIQSKANNVIRVRAGMSEGSGTLVDMHYVPYSGYHGIIITCYHVVRGHLTGGNRFIEVALNDSPDYFRYARLMDNGYDTRYDIAVFETVGPVLHDFAPTLEWANGDTLAEGQKVLTFGDARGDGIVTSEGVVDAVNISEFIEGVNQTMTLIRVTSQIISGKSGGPTFDMQGRLIGINIGTRGGLGYLIPAADARDVLERIIL